MTSSSNWKGRGSLQRSNSQPPCRRAIDGDAETTHPARIGGVDVAKIPSDSIFAAFSVRFREGDCAVAGDAHGLAAWYFVIPSHHKLTYLPLTQLMFGNDWMAREYGSYQRSIPTRALWQCCLG